MEFDKFRKGTLDQKIRDSISIPICWIKKGWLMLFVVGSSSLTKVVQLMFEHKIIYWFKWLKQEEWMGDTKDHNPLITWIKIFWQFWFKKLVCLQDLHILFSFRQDKLIQFYFGTFAVSTCQLISDCIIYRFWHLACPFAAALCI